MPGDVQVTTMACEACNGHFPVADMRSREGRVICKHCFAKEKEGEPATPADMVGGGRKYRIRGVTSCHVWAMPGQSYNLCGFTEDKSRFYLGRVDDELLDKTVKILVGGGDPETVLGENLVAVEMQNIAGAGTATSSPVLEVAVETGDGPRTLGLTFKNVPQKNQAFVELANSLDDRLLCRSEMTMDWGAVNRTPIMLTVVLLIVTLAVVALLALAVGGLAALMALLAGFVLVLAGGGWSARTIARTPKRPVRMTLIPHQA